VLREEVGHLQGAGAVHGLAGEFALPPLNDIEDAAARHGLPFNKVLHGVETFGGPGMAQAGFRKPTDVNVTPEESCDLRKDLGSSSTVGDASWLQLVDSKQGDACQREILVSRLICK
jgi:hypothetical protein